MTVDGAKELAGAFRTARKNTIQIAEDIPVPHLTREMQERIAQLQDAARQK